MSNTRRLRSPGVFDPNKPDLHEVSAVPAVYEYWHSVLPEEADGQGHANNVAYVQWLQDAAVAHAAAQGWSMDACRAAGIAWVARSHFIEYRRPAYPGDRIVVRTWISDMRRIASTRHYRIERVESDSERPQRLLLARAETVWVLVDAQSGKPKRIPADVEASFQLVSGPPDEDLLAG